MARKKIGIEEWILGQEAATILTQNSGHPVSANYVRLLASKGAIRTRPRDGRTNEYHKGDVMAYRVEPKFKKDRPANEENQEKSAESAA
jgi:hypothetical protein